MNEVAAFYNERTQYEWERLERHRTEFAITLRVLAEYLPPPPARIIDIGGGPGRYAIELAAQSYAVTLVDLAPENLRVAQERATEVGVDLANCIRADARRLYGMPDASFDAVLLMGPLYHLLDAEGRLQAAQEARRVLAPSGLLFAAWITRFAPFRDSAQEHPEWVVENYAYAQHLLETGQHVGAQGFTAAYFAHPDEIASLMEEAGFATLHLFGVEGIVAGHEEKINALTGDAWEKWVDLNYRLSREPSLHGAADHLLYVGRKVRCPTHAADESVVE